MTIAIDVSRCDRSPGCMARRACPKGAIVPLQGGGYPGELGYRVDEDRCAECAVCVRACPYGAVRWK